MAILKSAEGKFYEVPDDQLASCEIPSEEVKQKLEEAGCTPGGGGGPRSMRGGLPPQVVIQVFGGARGGGAPAMAGAGGEVAPYSTYCHHCHHCHRCHHCH